MRVRLTNAASISVAVASYQVDLRSRVSGKDPLVRGSGEVVCGCGRVLGTAPGWCAGAGACRARRAVSVKVQTRAGHGIGVVVGADVCWARRAVRVEVRARTGHGIEVVCGYRRVLGTALRCAVVCAFGRVLGTACEVGFCGYG